MAIDHYDEQASVEEHIPSQPVPHTVGAESQVPRTSPCSSHTPVNDTTSSYAALHTTVDDASDSA